MEDKRLYEYVAGHADPVDTPSVDDSALLRRMYHLYRALAKLRQYRHESLDGAGYDDHDAL